MQLLSILINHADFWQSQCIGPFLRRPMELRTVDTQTNKPALYLFVLLYMFIVISLLLAYIIYLD